MQKNKMQSVMGVDRLLIETIRRGQRGGGLSFVR